MDSDLGDRTFALVSPLRGDVSVQNEYPNMHEDIITITGSRDALIKRIMNDVGDPLNTSRILIRTNSGKFANEIHRRIGSAHIVNSVRMMANEYRVVICMTNISFTGHHFQQVYGYFTPTNSLVETWRKMIFQQPSDDYYICIDNLAPNGDGFDNNVGVLGHLSMSGVMDLPGYKLFAHDDETNAVNSFHQHIHLWGLLVSNRSYLSALNQFISQCELTGATVWLAKDIPRIDKAIFAEAVLPSATGCSLHI